MNYFPLYIPQWNPQQNISWTTKTSYKKNSTWQTTTPSLPVRSYVSEIWMLFFALVPINLLVSIHSCLARESFKRPLKPVGVVRSITANITSASVFVKVTLSVRGDAVQMFQIKSICSSTWLPRNDNVTLTKWMQTSCSPWLIRKLKQL